jgi:hypothetical protein
MFSIELVSLHGSARSGTYEHGSSLDPVASSMFFIELVSLDGSARSGTHEHGSSLDSVAPSMFCIELVSLDGSARSAYSSITFTAFCVTSSLNSNRGILSSCF